MPAARSERKEKLLKPIAAVRPPLWPRPRWTNRHKPRKPALPHRGRVKAPLSDARQKSSVKKSRMIKCRCLAHPPRKGKARIFRRRKRVGWKKTQLHRIGRWKKPIAG